MNNKLFVRIMIIILIVAMIIPTFAFAIGAMFA